jgi:hypothetical protein
MMKTRDKFLRELASVRQLQAQQLQTASAHRRQAQRESDPERVALCECKAAQLDALSSASAAEAARIEDHLLGLTP